MQVDSVSALVSQVPMINFLFLGANTYMMLNIKLAISKIETKIAEDRRTDTEQIKKWVEDKLDAHKLTCSGFKPHS